MMSNSPEMKGAPRMRATAHKRRFLESRARRMTGWCGIGMVVATQNAVDIDYQSMANAGSCFIGRLQTETDKKRVL